MSEHTAAARRAAKAIGKEIHWYPDDAGTERFASIIDAEIKPLVEALDRLRKRYVANEGSEHEFICMVDGGKLIHAEWTLAGEALVRAKGE